MRRSQSGKALKIAAIVTAAVIFLTGAALLTVKVIVPTVKYNNALSLMESGQYSEAIHAFRRLDGYKDSDKKIEQCELLREEQSELEDLEWRYNKALKYMEQGRYDLAIKNFEKIPDYKDSETKRKECEALFSEQRYQEALQLTADDKTVLAALAFGKLDGYKDSLVRSMELWSQVRKPETIGAGYDFTVGLKTDGTVVAAGYGSHTLQGAKEWTNIVSISAGHRYVVGLKSNGTVVATGIDSANDCGQCEVGDWTDIVAISASFTHTVGLKSDGTVVAVGANSAGQCNVSDWTNIVAISTGSSHTVGLRADGTVVVAGSISSEPYNTSDWTDIVSISAQHAHVAGLKSDGTVVATGHNASGRCDVSEWTDIIAIVAGSSETFALKADGSLISTNGGDIFKYDKYLQNIIVFTTSDEYFAGLKADGTVVVFHTISNMRKEIFELTDIAIP